MAVFRVLDALDAPHGGSILRLRLQEGDAPSIKEIKGRKVIVSSTLSAHGKVCAKGEVVAVQMPEGLFPDNN